MTLSLSSHGVSWIVTKVNEVPARRSKKDGRLGGGIAALLKNKSQSAFCVKIISSIRNKNAGHTFNIYA